ncbi:hypothetical protein QE152_g6559 [Popillia japonica]|uniref:Uncharacterized protein n=1 Tax=Popillia japonica TaxID=7064 RepID=A0AAW1MHZ4_POPJA
MSAYGKGGTIKNAVSMFKKCGIFPFNPEVFSEGDFIASDLYNHAPTDVQSGTENADIQLSVTPATTEIVNPIHKTPEKTTAHHYVEANSEIEDPKAVYFNMDMVASTSSNETKSPSFRDLIPVTIKKTAAPLRKRRVAHSTVSDRELLQKGTFGECKEEN